MPSAPRGLAESVWPFVVPVNWRKTDRRMWWLGGITWLMILISFLLACFNTYMFIREPRWGLVTAPFILVAHLGGVWLMAHWQRVKLRHAWAIFFGHTMRVDLDLYPEVSVFATSCDCDAKAARDEIESWCDINLRGPYTNLPRLGWNYYRIFSKKDAAMFRLRFN